MAPGRKLDGGIFPVLPDFAAWAGRDLPEAILSVHKPLMGED
jgi:hypothetical protein